MVSKFFACGVMALLAMGLVGASEVPSIAQKVTLKPGWNAVYLRVSPNVSTEALFKDWPVTSVSVYNAASYSAAHTFTASSGEETAAAQPFYFYSKESGVSTLGSKLPGDSILVCFNNTSEAFTTTVVGAPVAPRIAWHKSSESGSLNYVAVSVAGETVKLRQYFEGMKFAKVYRYGGAEEHAPKASTVLTGMDTVVKDGEVFLLPGDRVSDWSGVLDVSPRTGVNFGSEHETTGFTITNDGTVERTVTVAYGASPEGSVMQPSLHCLNDTIVAAPTWEAWSAPLTRKLSPGEQWTIMVAMDRSQFTEADAGKTVGGILTITEDGASQMKVQVPVQAIAKASASNYPAGLWVANITLNSVDRVVDAGTIHRDLPAGGTMKFRALLHVDKEGKCRLLQRVTLVGTYSQDGVFTSALYAGGAKVPAAHEITLRYSCVTLPTDVPIIASSNAAKFGDTQTGVIFDYTIGANSASNPYHHPYHPDHDGKDWDFKTQLPDGRNFEAYQETVKPETFSVDGRVEFKWTAASGEWKPTKQVTGTCRWGYVGDMTQNEEGEVTFEGGLRHEGELWASGTFTMECISEDATLIVE